MKWHYIILTIRGRLWLCGILKPNYTVLAAVKNKKITLILQKLLLLLLLSIELVCQSAASKPLASVGKGLKGPCGAFDQSNVLISKVFISFVITAQHTITGMRWFACLLRAEGSKKVKGAKCCSNKVKEDFAFLMYEEFGHVILFRNISKD